MQVGIRHRAVPVFVPEHGIVDERVGLAGVEPVAMLEMIRRAGSLLSRCVDDVERDAPRR